ncbi:HAMP domain-containing histidine kinase [bacterium]|nr:HAMP domain-containing histidine kinase [bacterium]
MKTNEVFESLISRQNQCLLSLYRFSGENLSFEEMMYGFVEIVDLLWIGLGEATVHIEYRDVVYSTRKCSSVVKKIVEDLYDEDMIYSGKIECSFSKKMIELMDHRCERLIQEIIEIISCLVSQTASRKKSQLERKIKEESWRELQGMLRLGSWEYLSKTGELILDSGLQQIFSFKNKVVRLEEFVGTIPNAEDRADFLANLSRTLIDGDIFERSFNRVLPNGMEAFSRESFVRKEIEGEFVVFGVWVDDTAFRTLTEETESLVATLEGVNKKKEEFLLNMTHELRSPLNVVLGYAQHLENLKELEGEPQEHVKKIINSSHYLLGLINDLLLLGKSDSGKLETNKTSFDLIELLEEIQDFYQLETSERGLSLNFENNAFSSVVIVSDKDKLKQIIINFFSNALKFTMQGSVNLYLSMADDVIKLGVKDTGIGIDPENLERIFGYFEQVKVGMDNMGGTGIGLSLCKSLGSALGAKVSAESEVGKGSFFFIEFSPTIEFFGAKDDISIDEDVFSEIFENQESLPEEAREKVEVEFEKDDLMGLLELLEMGDLEGMDVWKTERLDTKKAQHRWLGTKLENFEFEFLLSWIEAQLKL